jgi:hypothetical protein
MPAPRKKLKRNISGLKNQPPTTSGNDSLKENVLPTNSEPNIDTTSEQAPCQSEGLAEGSDSHRENTLNTHYHPDDIRPHWEEEEVEADHVMGFMDEGIEDDICRKGLQIKMLALAMSFGDDPRDEDWIPPKLRYRKAKEQIGK